MSSQAKCRVVVLDHCAQMSGAELALLRLLPHCTDVQFRVILAEDGPLRPALEAVGVSTEILSLPARTARLSRSRASVPPLLSLVDVLVYTGRLAWRLGRLHPDVVHTNSSKAHLYGGVAARLAGVPQLWHARDRAAAEFLPRGGVALLRAAAKILPTMVVANSRSTLSTLPGARGRSRAARAGVNLVLDDPALPQGDVIRRKKPLVVGMVGRLTPWKGQDVFLRAFARAFGAPSDTRAVVIGSAMFGEHDYVRQLESLTEQLGIQDRVSFTGFLEDVPKAMARLDILVHASVIPEPFGQVVVEGMALGLPVVAVGVGGPAEIIDDGRTGLLYVMGDEAALATTLGRLAEDPRLRAGLGEAARAASRRFRPEVVATQLTDIYHAVQGA